MVAEPWNRPDTIKLVCCVFEILCTVQGNGDLRVAIAIKEELSLMRKNKSEHKRLYKRICEILKEINVEEAEACKKSDCEDNMMKTSKTNLAAALTEAMRRELGPTEKSELVPMLGW